MEIVKCEEVTKIYGSGQNKVIALNQINLTVEKGEFIAITGASGSGKSTLLHLIGGVDKPTEGQIRIPGILWFWYRISKIHRRNCFGV